MTLAINDTADVELGETGDSHGSLGGVEVDDFGGGLLER